MSRELDELDREFADLERGGGGGGDGRRRRGGARLLPIAVAVIALAVFGGIVWYAYNQGVRSGSEEAAPLLQPEGEAKAEPEDPGGMEVAHTDKDVYERISGDGEAEETVERILPPPEDPMSPPRASESGTGSDVDTPEIPSITESESDAGTGAGGNGEPPLPDEKLAAPDSEPPTAAPAGEEATDTRTAAADGDAEAGAQTESGAESGTSDSAETGDAPQETASAESGTDPEAAEPAAEDTDGDEPDTAEPAAEEQTAAAAPTSGWQVQIAAVGSEAAAERAWRQQQEALPDLLGDLSLSIQRAEVDGKTYFRVRGGPLSDRASAESRCEALKAKDQGCLVVSPGS